MFKANDVMTKNVVTAATDTTVDGVVALLLRHRLSGMPVIDKD